MSNSIPAGQEQSSNQDKSVFSEQGRAKIASRCEQLWH